MLPDESNDLFLNNMIDTYYPLRPSFLEKFCYLIKYQKNLFKMKII